MSRLANEMNEKEQKDIRLTVENFFFMVVVLQLLVFALLNRFVLVPTNYLRWIIDAGLYSLALLVLLTSKLKPDKIFFLYTVLLIMNVLSFIANNNELLSLIKQIRFTFMGGMIYILLLYGKFSKRYFEKLIKTLFFIGYLQLPIVIIQLIFYRYISQKYIGPLVDYIDYAAGSVGYSDSGVLGIFLLILSIVKIQEGLTYTFNKRIAFQLLLLLAPLGLINSDAQFFFLPMVAFFALLINKKIIRNVLGFLFVFKINKNALRFLFVFMIAIISINALVQYNWKGNRTIMGYISGRVGSIISDSSPYAGHRLKRPASMRYVWGQDTRNPSIESIMGKGPGYWLERDSEGGSSSITDVWYHGNTILLMYGELGLLGLSIFLLIPFVFFIETDNSFWGKVIKLQSFYLFLLLFYHHPLNRLSLIIPLMIFIVYFRRYHYKKTKNL